MDWIRRIRSFFAFTTRFVVVVLFAGFIAGLALQMVFPWLAVSSWANHFSFLRRLGRETTIIERTEQVVLPTDQGVERLLATPKPAIVRVFSSPIGGFRLNQAVPVVTQEFTGTLITNDGLVATYTNDIPKKENRRFTVLFTDGEISLADYVGYDSVLNIAYFRSQRSNTATLPFANSDDMRMGQRYIALGATRDIEEIKVKTGIVSEQARTINLAGKTVASTDKWEGVYIMDGGVDSSFAGGPALSPTGELLGLIGFIPTDQSNTVFIVPSNVLQTSFRRVLDGTLSERLVFGAYYISLTKESALALGVARDRGALIYTPSGHTGLAVLSGSPAERMGLQYGDIVIAVDGREVNLDHPFSSLLYERKVGEPLTLTILRGGNEETLTLNAS